MQYVDDVGSVKAICGARVKCLVFGSRSCNDNERNFHFSTGERACGRCDISQHRKYLWIYYFY